MQNFEEEKLLKIIESHSGLSISEAHKNFMNIYVNRRIEELAITLDEFCSLILNNPTELENLINEAAINETYFFREEQQFDFLKEKYLPSLLKTTVKIWSAACSTGEEAFSLYALCLSLGLKPDIYATDIDTAAMSILKRGMYSNNSFRSDGKKYHALLKKIGQHKDFMFNISDDIKKDIHLERFNLSDCKNLPVEKESVDIIFIRNVFIYFSQELRNKIIMNLSSALKEGGILLLSINEIASIECLNEFPLTKEHFGSVYYFRKTTNKNKTTLEKKVYTPPPLPKTSEIKTEYKKVLKITNNLKSQTSSLKQITSQKELEALYKDIQKALEKKDTILAENLLNSYTFRAEQKEFNHYFRALIYKEKSQVDKALKEFSKAGFSSIDFWIAHFESAILYKQIGKIEESKKEFLKCINKLKIYEKNKKLCYNFLIEQFSTEYFLTLCENILKDL